MGGSFRVADAYLLAILGWVHSFGIDLGRWPELSTYAQRIADRPSVAAADMREDEIPPVL